MNFNIMDNIVDRRLFGGSILIYANGYLSYIRETIRSI